MFNVTERAGTNHHIGEKSTAEKESYTSRSRETLDCLLKAAEEVGANIILILTQRRLVPKVAL